MPQYSQHPPVKHTEKMRRKAVERKHLLAAKGGRIDVPFLLLTLLLTAIGLVMLFSASFPSAYYETGNPAYYFKRQAIFAALGLSAMFVVAKVNYQRWRGAARLLLGFSVFLLILVIIPHVAHIFVGYDAQLLALTSRAFRLYALCFLIKGFNIYASSFFTALGDGVTSALISFLRTLLFQVAAVLILPELLGLDGIWLAVTAAELAALAVSAAMLLTKDKVFHYRKA